VRLTRGTVIELTPEINLSLSVPHGMTVDLWVDSTIYPLVPRQGHPPYIPLHLGSEPTAQFILPIYKVRIHVDGSRAWFTAFWILPERAPTGGFYLIHVVEAERRHPAAQAALYIERALRERSTQQTKEVQMK
jgi:hypothetical protein